MTGNLSVYAIGANAGRGSEGTVVASRSWTRSRAYWKKHPRRIAFGMMALLVLAMSAGAVVAGFPTGLGANLLVNSAGDLISGLMVLMLIEPIVAQAAIQVRQRERLDFRKFVREIDDTEREILVLDTATEIFKNKAWGTEDKLLDAVRRGVTIRVLLMMPHSSAATVRRMQLFDADPYLELSREIYANISEFRELDDRVTRLRAAAAARQRGPGSFELRLYASATPFTLYAHDDLMSFALVPAASYTYDSEQLELSSSSVTGSQVRKKFDELWSTAMAIRATMPLWIDDGSTRIETPYVMHRSKDYITSEAVTSALSDGENHRFWIEGGDGARIGCVAEPVKGTSSLYGDLTFEYEAKYKARVPNLMFFQLRRDDEVSAPIGRMAAYRELPIDEVLALVTKARRTVRVLDTSSAMIGDSESSPYAGFFRHAALEALQHGARIRILLMEPASKAAYARASNINDAHFGDRVDANIRRLRELIKLVETRADPGLSKRLQVRLYNQLPDLCVHQVDDRVYTAFLVRHDIRTSSAAQLEVHRSSELGDHAVSSFQKLWERTRPLSGMRYVTVTEPEEADHRLLIRAWQFRDDWYAASNRLEVILGRPTQPETRFILEGGRDEYTLSGPVDRADPVWDEYTARYSATSPGPGIPIRQFRPVRD